MNGPKDPGARMALWIAGPLLLCMGLVVAVLVTAPRLFSFESVRESAAHSSGEFSFERWKAHDLRYRHLVMEQVRAKVKIGMSESDVIDLLGLPNEVNHRRWSYHAGYPSHNGENGRYGELGIHFRFGSRGRVSEVVINR